MGKTILPLKNYLKKLNINTGRIFEICDKSVALKIKKYAMLAGLDYKKYAGVLCGLILQLGIILGTITEIPYSYIIGIN